MAEDKPCKRSVPQLSCFSVEGIGDGDKNSAPDGSTISACETELEEGDVSAVDRETVKNAQHLSGDQCNIFCTYKHIRGFPLSFSHIIY